MLAEDKVIGVGGGLRPGYERTAGGVQERFAEPSLEFLRASLPLAKPEGGAWPPTAGLERFRARGRNAEVRTLNMTLAEARDEILAFIHAVISRSR